MKWGPKWREERTLKEERAEAEKARCKQDEEAGQGVRDGTTDQNHDQPEEKQQDAELEEKAVGEGKETGRAIKTRRKSRTESISLQPSEAGFTS